MNKQYPLANYQEYRTSRNPYAKIIRDFRNSRDFSTVLADAETEKYRGRWREYFRSSKQAFLNLELGAYHGETSIHLGKHNEQNIHLAVEWKYKQCFKAGKKALDNGLQNLTFLRANIARLPWMVAPGEVDRIWVLFPDPWSKKSQQKWRLLQPRFFHTMGALLSEGKELLIKTDHAEYAEFIKHSILTSSCFDQMENSLAKERWALIPPTPFERIFIRKGLPIYSFALVRNRNKVILPEEVKDILTL